MTEASHSYQFIEAQLSQLSREGDLHWPELEPPEQQLVRTDIGRKDANPDAFKALEDHLAVAGLHDLGWVENAGRLYKESRAGQTGGVPWDLVSQLLEGWSKVYKGAPLEAGTNVVKEREREENFGDKLILELGLRLGLFESDKESQNDLNLLMCFVDNLCGPGVGYDWTAAAIFLLSKGNLDLASSVLASLTTTLAGKILWPRLSSSKAVLAGIGHCVDVVVNKELPAVAVALRLAKINVAMVVHLWLQQAFFNVLDINAFADFLLTGLLLGPEYPVYFCVAIFDHLQPRIVELESCNLLNSLLATPLSSFRSMFIN